MFSLKRLSKKRYREHEIAKHTLVRIYNDGNSVLIRIDSDDSEYYLAIPVNKAESVCARITEAAKNVTRNTEIDT